MGSVNVTLVNGQLGGTLQTNDGIFGMVITGVTEGGYTVGDCILVTGLASLALAGITNAGNPFAYRQIKEFYDGVGKGAQLYLMLVPYSMNVLDMTDHTNANGAKKLLLFADGKIKVLGVIPNDFLIDDFGIGGGMNGDIYDAAINLDQLANDFFALEKPLRCLIGGSCFTGVAADLDDITDGTTYNRVGIVVGDTVSSSTAPGAVGLAMGRLAAVPVQRKISRVKDGPLSNTVAYLGTGTLEAAAGAEAVIASKGFITWQRYPNKSGYFWSGDHMFTANTDDYSMLARGRVIDKAHVLAYSVFVEEVDDEVLVNADGTIDAGFAKWLQQQIVGAINTTMVANKEISAVDCYINPSQNIIATSTLNVVLKIRPVGYASDIEISLGFEQ